MYTLGRARPAKTVLLILALILASQTVGLSTISCAPETGVHYYVDSTNGSDNNPGTSRSQAWRTIQKAAATMIAGDTCTVLPGLYNERVHVVTSGSSGTPITYEAEGTVVTKGFTVRADYIVVQGFEITNTDDLSDDGIGIFVEGSHCIIENNYIHDATRGGILLYVSPGDETRRTDCLVRNNILYHNALAGIQVHGRNHVVVGNDISRTIQYHPRWVDPPNWVDADGIRFFGSGHLFKGNYIHDITYSDPENPTPHIDCFQTWGSDSYHEPASNIVFERNTCILPESLTSTKRTNGFMLEQATSLLIRNNVLFANTDVNAYSGTNSTLTIVNNTFVGNLSWPANTYPAGVNLQNCPNTVVKNNIFYNLPASVYLIWGTIPGLDVGYNLTYRTDGQVPGGAPYPTDLWGVDPLLVDPTAQDYHLQPASPAIDNGYQLREIVPDDHDGNSRPRGPRYDIGAFEYNPEVSMIGVLIIDDTDPSFSTQSGEDAWQEFIDLGGQHYGYGHHYNRQVGTGSDTATWSFSLPWPGEYRVYAWWAEGSEKPTDVPYTVNHLGGSTTIPVNQQVNGGQWNLLGTFAFQQQGSVGLSDDASSGQKIVADAIKLVYVWPYSIYLPHVTRHSTSL